MEKRKTANISSDIKDINREPKVRHLMSIFAVVKEEDGEKKEVDLRKIVGSKGK